MIICLYADDLLIFGTNMKVILDTNKYLTSQFKMKDRGKVDTIIGIKVKKQSGSYALSQSHYIEKVLLKFQHLKFKKANTPYDSSIKLLENSCREVAQRIVLDRTLLLLCAKCLDILAILVRNIRMQLEGYLGILREPRIWTSFTMIFQPY